MMSSTSRAMRAAVRATALLAVALACQAAHAASDDRVLVVLNSGGATVSIVDPVSLKTVRTIDTGKEPHHLMPTPDGREVIVASSAGNSLMFLDGRSGNVERVL